MKTYILAFSTILFIASCGNNNTAVEENSTLLVENNTLELTEAQFKNSKIESGTLNRRILSSTLRVSGKIDVPPQNMVSISVPMGGYLKSTQLLEGMHISKGDILATMEDQQYIQLQQDYLTAKAHFVYTENEYNRQKDLNQSKASSDKQFQQIQAEYQSQKVVLKALSEKLKLIGINPDNLNENTISRSISIYSPIDGFVSAIKANIGKYITPTDILFELVNPADIHLALTVFEKDLDRLYVGQKVFAYNNAHPEKKYLCEIILIGQDITHEGTVVIHCHFDKYDKSLVPGMYMTADVELKSDNLYVIPNDAVVNYEGKQYVFLQTSPLNYQLQEIKLGNSENGFTQLQLNDTTAMSSKTFVTKGAYTLLMKMKNKSEE